MAVPSGVASALMARIAANGSLLLASDSGWPETLSPASMSQVASCHCSSRQSWAISVRASWCSWDSIQMPVKHALTYSERRVLIFKVDLLVSDVVEGIAADWPADETQSSAVLEFAHPVPVR